MADHFGDPDNILTDHPEIHRSIFVIAVRLCIVLRRRVICKSSVRSFSAWQQCEQMKCQGTQIDK